MESAYPIAKSALRVEYQKEEKYYNINNSY
jgi:hypothetical protein